VSIYRPKEINLWIECGTHKKGEPYPQYDFTLVKEYEITNKYSNDKSVIAASNEDLKIQIDRLHETRDEVKYFYYTLKSGE
jgi:hypothetical protein